MVSDLNKNFGGSKDLAEKARIGGLASPYLPPSGDDQFFEYDDDSDNDSDCFIVEKDCAIRDMQSEELGFLLALRRTRSRRKVTTTRKVLLWTLFFKM